MYFSCSKKNEKHTGCSKFSVILLLIMSALRLDKISALWSSIIWAGVTISAQIISFFTLTAVRMSIKTNKKVADTDRGTLQTTTDGATLMRKQTITAIAADKPRRTLSD